MNRCGNTFPELKDCCCLSLLNTGRRRTERFSSSFRPKSSLRCRLAEPAERLKSKTKQKTASPLLIKGKLVPNICAQAVNTKWAATLLEVSQITDPPKKQKKYLFNIYGSFHHGPNVLVVLTLMTPNVESAARTLEACRRYLNRIIAAGEKSRASR